MIICRPLIPISTRPVMSSKWRISSSETALWSPWQGPPTNKPELSPTTFAASLPRAVPIYLKLLFSTDGGKIYGAQRSLARIDGVDKRIDTIGTAIRLGAGVSALKDLELAYAPPFNSARILSIWQASRPKTCCAAS